MWDIIAMHHVAIGMTEEQVLMSWGNPGSRTDYNSSSSSAAQWVYDHDILFFYNGLLDSVTSY